MKKAVRIINPMTVDKHEKKKSVFGQICVPSLSIILLSLNLVNHLIKKSIFYDLL